MYFGLEGLWFLTGLSTTRTFVPVLEAVDILESDMIRILPALHALTCNSINEISTKGSKNHWL